MKRYYPVMLDIENKNAVVIGGGEVAYRKVINLLDYGAKVLVVSEVVSKEIKSLIEEKKITYVNRNYLSDDLNNAYIVYAATDDNKVNQQIYQDAHNKNILINVVDVPVLCDFIVPATVSRGDLTISISTNGKSPLLSSKIRKELEETFGTHYETFLNIMGELREKISSEISDPKKRRTLYEALVFSDFLQRLSCEDELVIKEEMNKLFDNHRDIWEDL